MAEGIKASSPEPVDVREGTAGVSGCAWETEASRAAKRQNAAVVGFIVSPDKMYPQL